MTGLGVVVGLVLVVWLTRYVSSLLFGVVPLDPTTLVGGGSNTGRYSKGLSSPSMVGINSVTVG